MSNDNDTNDYSDWLDKYYDRFDYSDFTVLEKIDTGSSAQIKIATIKDIKDPKFVLKCFNYDKITLKGIVNEIQLQRQVNYHPNIIRLYGITKGCWKYEPDERPDIQKVVSILKKELASFGVAWEEDWKDPARSLLM
ncbi:hypothetical protein RhiirA4_512709 [Rhizophagus irregularis]|uniref:Protein kinase domain-containing protein n=1 Tax=Rhizophagus irregularis TaxID=588596 RepID=A0A2I1GC31_9GLOM|nr:hypothetical protein RhiirA4_512709 [Rhizophagus irregularis]